METKVYMLEDLGCAHCAAKIEEKIAALPEVEAAVLTFATRQLRVTAETPDELLEKLNAVAQSVEPEVRIVMRQPRRTHSHTQCACGHDRDDCEHAHEHDHHHDHEACSCGRGHDRESCACGHDHTHEHEHAHGHDHSHSHGGGEGTEIGIGAALFALGLLLGTFGIYWGAVAAYLCAYVVLGRGIAVSAVKNLVRGRVLDENFLMTVAALGAFAIGEFPEAVGVMLFYRVGEYFEEKAVDRSRSQIMAAVDLRPEIVSRVSADGVQVIAAEEARVGDLLLVRPGDRIPLDGTVMSGSSRIDTAPVTGEPVPVAVAEGDRVISGCVNTAGQLTIRVEKVLSESVVTRILNSVENAAASKPQIDRFITRFARIYTPIVVGLAALVAIIPSLITRQWHYWVYTALSFLVMSCPCALVLSVPLSFFSGIGAGSRQGILFKGGASMEAMGRIKSVVMDKTGTITRGDFTVQQISGGETLALAAACEAASTHPIAQSILLAASERGVTVQRAEEMEEIAGCGVHARLNGREILCGNEKLLTRFGAELPDELPAAGTQVHVAADGAYVGSILIADTLKDGAASAIAALKAQGLATAMLTGDETRNAQSIAAATGIDEVRARLLPDEKLTHLQQIRERHGAVMYVGDGINDAPVLAGADVGAAMGNGADAAIEAADVVFMTSDVSAIPKSIAIARSTAAIARQNVIFALTVKLVVMALGLTGYASMWMAVFADSGVAMLCVLNSIRLLYIKHGRK